MIASVEHHEHRPEPPLPLEVPTDLPNKIRVRQLTEADDEAFFDLFWRNKEEIEKGGLHYEGRYETPELVAKRREEEASATMFGVFLDGKLAGGVEVGETDDPETREISYFLDREQRGQGIARVAVNAVVRRLLQVEKKDVKAYVDPSNKSSANLLRILKFKPNSTGDTYRRNTDRSAKVAAAALSSMRSAELMHGRLPVRR